jgi:hypothetical protein
MLPKFLFIAYYLLPLAIFGQDATAPNYPITESPRLERNFDPAGYFNLPAIVPFPDTWGFSVDSREPFSGKAVFGQSIYREPISLISMTRPGEDRMGVSATGALIYTGTDDVFAYAHYGRTGNLIWRTSPIVNNMMATRWSLANVSIFRKTASRRTARSKNGISIQ